MFLLLMSQSTTNTFVISMGDFLIHYDMDTELFISLTKPLINSLHRYIDLRRNLQGKATLFA